MDHIIDETLSAHAAWKKRLLDSIAIGVTPDEATTRADDRCVLGKWIHGEGKKYRAFPEFALIITGHARFHEAAGEVIKMINAGKKAEALHDIESGAYAKASVDFMVDAMLALDTLIKKKIVKE